jgi:glucose-1-phosphate thymidylyltransferase
MHTLQKGSIAKAVILAAGRGTRMRRIHDSVTLDAIQAGLAANGQKALMPVGRPFIDYVLSGLADAGYRHVCLVIGPAHDALREHVCRLDGGRLTIDVAVQPEPLGTAKAVESSEEFAAGDPFLLINGDNYYPQSALSRLRSLKGAAVAAFRAAGLCRGNIAADRLRQYALLLPGADESLERVIEKPGEEYFAGHQETLLFGMNCWRFTPLIFKACRAIALSARGEYELTDAVSFAINRLGERFEVLAVDDPVLDLSTQADVAEVARRLADVEVRL